MIRRIFFLLSAFLIMHLNVQSQQDIKCSLWNPANYCIAPESLCIFSQTKCLFCNTSYISCDNIDSIKNATGVIISINNNSFSKLKFKNKLKNIYLLNNKGEKIFPVAFAWIEGVDCNDKSPVIKYLDTKEFKAINFNLVCVNANQLKLLFIFKGAEKGNTFTFKNVIENKIIE
ncbi:MAG TPA: hypothetical protein PKK00_06180 [Bacteroidales bacterium]|nr:hypothetical protein [Bacteroidales bacterium]HPS16878.1 hypothetical protein [Bacteroidales bacterium]